MSIEIPANIEEIDRSAFVESGHESVTFVPNSSLGVQIIEYPPSVKFEVDREEDGGSDWHEDNWDVNSLATRNCLKLWPEKKQKTIISRIALGMVVWVIVSPSPSSSEVAARYHQSFSLKNVISLRQSNLGSILSVEIGQIQQVRPIDCHPCISSEDWEGLVLRSQEKHLLFAQCPKFLLQLKRLEATLTWKESRSALQPSSVWVSKSEIAEVTVS